MIYFDCDYLEGAHPRILQLMQDTNMVQTSGYGEDAYCEKARDLIKKAPQYPRPCDKPRRPRNTPHHS